MKQLPPNTEIVTKKYYAHCTTSPTRNVLPTKGMDSVPCKRAQSSRASNSDETRLSTSSVTSHQYTDDIFKDRAVSVRQSEMAKESNLTGNVNIKVTRRGRER